MTNITSIAVAPRRARGRVLIRRAVIALLATVLIGYLTIATVAANVLTIPVRKQVTRLDTGWQYLTDPQKSAGLAYQEITFPARVDHLQIRGWFVPASDRQRAIVFVHGKDGCRPCEFQGKALQFVKALHERGFNVFMTDLRGHGESADAHFTFGVNERHDIEGAVDWLKTQGFGAGSIGVLGVSMGAASSIDATAEDPDIAALVSDCAYADIYPILQSEFPKASHLPGFFLPGTVFLARWAVGADIRRLIPVDEIRRVAPRPVLLIHGTGDKLIPFKDAQELAAAAPSSELWLVDGAPHAGSYAANPAAYVDRVTAFFNHNLK